MEIAKGVRSTDYLSLKLDVNDISSDWDMAFDYLKKRVEERFLNPIDKLIEAESNLLPYQKSFGFAILALDCLLLETIQSFYEGIINSKGASKGLFVTFLTSQRGFKEKFDRELAEDFYTKYRCGILHQGQTDSDAKVWSVGELIGKRGDHLIVNREEFHRNIVSVFKRYLEELKEKDDVVLLKNFKNKMDFIAGIG